MTALPHFDAAAISAVVDMDSAIKALKEAFKDLGKLHPRTQVSLGTTDDLLLMPAVTSMGIGIKTVTVISDNPGKGLPLIHAHYLLCDRDTGRPQATFDGSALTALRTPAASGVATEMLAPLEVTSLGIFGTGVQAQGHIDAMLSARSSIETIFVSGRTLESTTNFVETANSQGRKILAATPEQAAECDVICGCTSATTPVIPTESVRNGAHINLVGSYSAARREVDTDLITKSSVFVDEREAAENEAGELIYADASDHWDFDLIVGDLSDLCLEKVGRTDNDEITLFKSVGLAVEDVVVAAAVWAAQSN